MAEAEHAPQGKIPGFRIWNSQIASKVPGLKGDDVLVGINNLTDKRYYMRNSDSNFGRMVGAPHAPCMCKGDTLSNTPLSVLQQGRAGWVWPCYPVLINGCSLFIILMP